MGPRGRVSSIFAIAAFALSGCSAGSQDGRSPSAPRSEVIAPDETIRLTGAEPFWGGTIASGRLVYTTPEDPAGQTVEVRRFAGLNGFGFAGRMGEQALDVVVTEAPCSDGMSDRIYPFSVVLQIGQDQRRGCGWTERLPYAGPATP